MPSNARLTWKVQAVVFIIISIALLIALIVVATKSHSDVVEHVKTCGDGMSSTDGTPKSAGVFDDLTVDEIVSVIDYLMSQTELNLTKFEEATVNSNYIYLVQLLPPSQQR